MLVSKKDFESIVAQLLYNTVYLALDTETTGLSPHLGDRLFSIVINNGKTSYYFNFQKYPGLDDEYVLPKELIRKFCFGVEHVLFMHNAKFDMAMLYYEGLELSCIIHDTELGARLIRNDFMKYSLDACAKRIGLSKSSAVDEFVKKHKLYEQRPIPESDDFEKIPRFDRVPLEIIQEYAEKDAEITYKLGMHQIFEIKQLDLTTPEDYPKISEVLEDDRRLIPVCFKMECVGAKINRAYAKECFDHERGVYETAAKKFEEKTGLPFKDSAQTFRKAFDAVGEKYPKTEKGNPRFDKDALEDMESPIAGIIKDYRKAYKKAHTYYKNFIYFADSNNRIHANIRMAGTTTYRFSYSEPNLQNLNKDEDTSPPYLVRRCFIPEDGYALVMIDYEQMEYRLMLDYANEEGLIKKILVDKLDVHQATANMVGISRSQAKTLNFGLLYGIGNKKLAKNLGVTVLDAAAFKDKYFKKLPLVKDFLRATAITMEEFSFVRGWNGFRYHIEDPNLSYKAANHVIQGGCANIVRRAMPRCDEILQGSKSRLILQVHDELIFEMHPDDFGLIPRLKEVMETTYPYTKLPMECEVSHSYKSWADKVKGFPT